jgi:hypothetical protein
MTNAKKQLIVPIYLDANILLDLIASMQGGFSMVEKVSTTDSTQNSTNVAARSLYAEVNTPFLKLGVAPTKDISNEGINSSSTEYERYQTYGSLLFNLREQLGDSIKHFSDWDKVQVGDFIELSGLFYRNPLVKGMETINKMVQMLEAMSIPLDGATTSNDNRNKKRKPSKSSLQQTKDVLESLLSDIRHDRVETFILNTTVNADYKAVITLLTDYLRDTSGTELANKEFTVLGKIVQNIKGKSNIDLLEETALGSIDDTILNGFFEVFNNLSDSGVNIPNMERYIPSPALRILPIAIYV